ncbi:MAG: rhamnan synthesis F family protein, partial [bacterium]|nr:rhamnan synthesis F family protein [bacterium]
MKPILIHTHVYYADMWTEQRDCIASFEDYPYTLYVTLLEGATEIKDKILADYPNAKILFVENRGYDIWPFIHVLNNVNLDD